MPLAALGPIAPETPRFARELARAERLFAERRYAPAREAFERLAAVAGGDEAELVQLRMAESDYFLKRFLRVREDLSPFLQRAARRAEARFFYLMTTQRLGNRDQYISQTRALVDDFPDSSWAEEALNNLASFHIVADEDDQADTVFRELASRFPSGRYTARAMWKIGWRAYRQKQHAEAADVFERAAVTFPRSDYRPSYLYWAAKAREQRGDAAGAEAGYRLVYADYANTYYGRLSVKALGPSGSAVPASGLAPAPRQAGGAVVPAAAPTAELIRWLIFVEMYDEALDEVQYAERASGASALLAATRAWLLNKTGDLRPGINLMRRTYPQFLAAGGESMPPEVLSVIYPAASYWPLISKHAAAHKLDPYLVAALIAQESTFDKDIESSAKAVGLMQIMPSTGAPVGEAARHPQLLDCGGSRWPESQRADRHGVLRRSDRAVRQRARSRWRATTRARAACALAARAAGPRARRVHRRHPVPRDAELREAAFSARPTTTAGSMARGRSRQDHRAPPRRRPPRPRAPRRSR